MMSVFAADVPLKNLSLILSFLSCAFMDSRSCEASPPRKDGRSLLFSRISFRFVRWSERNLVSNWLLISGWSPNFQIKFLIFFRVRCACIEYVRKFARINWKTYKTFTRQHLDRISYFIACFDKLFQVGYQIFFLIRGVVSEFVVGKYSI